MKDKTKINKEHEAETAYMYCMRCYRKITWRYFKNKHRIYCLKCFLVTLFIRKGWEENQASDRNIGGKETHDEQ